MKKVMVDEGIEWWLRICQDVWQVISQGMICRHSQIRPRRKQLAVGPIGPPSSSKVVVYVGGGMD